ncbi:GntR family transcriptional regulator [Paraburkholderia bannensis]|uniref:GntR family transcriptional regulator n=1 Tax=Paraburkholderia bannensis TaxID=765414 RepID=UPI002AB055B3|nr:GntR family transcriptional regulator [Paraburkholderia bannensis]
MLRGARIEALQVTSSDVSAPPDDEPLADGPVQPARRAPDLPSQIAAGIRELINDGVIAPGASLPQLQLAERFRVSRAPVREALKLLVAEAAVEHDPNRGFQVALLSSVEARQIYLIRRILESELCVRCAGLRGLNCGFCKTIWRFWIVDWPWRHAPTGCARMAGFMRSSSDFHLNT